MLVQDICCKDVATIESSATIRSAAEQMVARNVGSLIIVNDNNTPAGIITDRDITTRVVAVAADPAETRVGDIMMHPVVSVRGTAEIEMALGCMAFGVRRVPVVDEDDQLVGVISLDDFLLMYSTEFDQVRRVLRKEMSTAR